MDSVDLRFFLAVATTGGIGRAAKELNTVPSNVTQRIQSLERDLGVELFHRSKKRVVLSSFGSRLIPYAEQIKHTLREARSAMQESGAPHGDLRIGSMETTAAFRLPSLLTRFTSKYPDVDIQIDTGPTAALLEDVVARQLDGAFVSGPITHVDLLSIPIVTEELVLITPPAIESLPDLRASLRERGLKAIVFRSGCSYRQRLSEFLSHRGYADIRWMDMGTLDGIIGCVASSVGLSLLPRSSVGAAASEGIIRVHTLPNTIGKATTVFVRRKDALVSSALRAFMDCARSEASSSISRSPRKNGSNRAAALARS